MQLPEHGANSAQLYRTLNLPVPSRIWDFSENCNPAGPPPSVIEAWPSLITKLHLYPHPEGQPFKSAAAAYHHVHEESVIVGNGAAELLSLLAERYRGKRAIIVHPTFSEYEATLRAKGVDIIHLQAEEQDGFQLPIESIQNELSNADVLYLCTPNNPTGILPQRDDLMELIAAAKECGAEVVLDEAFIDFVDERHSFIPEIERNPHVIVVRSMTKLYAIPGIRLGYAVADPAVIEELQAKASHWNVNGIAAELGALCLQEEAYRQEAIKHAAHERNRMAEFLRAYRCRVIDSATNYIVFAPPKDTEKLYYDLLQTGIVLRHSNNFRGMDGRWLRVGMKTPAMMDMLREELAKWFAAN